METFSALLAIYARNSQVHSEFPAQRPVTRSFHVFFHLRLNKPLSKQSRGWWFETLSYPLWRRCNGNRGYMSIIEAAVARASGAMPLRWLHNGRDSVSNHQPSGCLLNRLCRRRLKKTSKLRVTGLFAGNSPGIPRTNGQSRGKCFHLMTSSCTLLVGMESPGFSIMKIKTLSRVTTIICI